ncbi:MAG: NAD-dependent epimerase/dehydratase family protein [Acidimicrobiia bacterium]
MHAVVTGAGGFIGSWLAEALVASGHRVTGIDAGRRVDGPPVGAPGPVAAQAGARFEVVRADLADPDVDLVELLAGAGVVFHLAAQPGVRGSWGEDFARYARDNVVATQRVLEAARRTPGLERVVVASSSSVYGEAGDRPSREDDPLNPRSPYGVSKLTAEHLCRVYAESWGVPTVMLRLFTVYGPRQRPDMALHRICAAALAGVPFARFGSGRARRDLTFVDDAVAAFLAAATADLAPATALNVAGGSTASLTELIDLVGSLAGAEVRIDDCPAQPGDVEVTSGDVEASGRLLGWAPSTPLAEGVARQLAWHRQAAPATIPG